MHNAAPGGAFQAASRHCQSIAQRKRHKSITDRRLRVQELQLVLEKLVKFIGKNVRSVVEREDEKYCFRLHKNRVYYVRESLVKKSTNVRSSTG